MAGTVSTSSTRGTSAAVGVALSTLAVLVGAGIVNTLISLGAQGLGADPAMVMGLQPGIYLLFTAVGALLGALGWQVVRRFASRPTRVLSWLVPLVVAVSLIPDVLLGLSFSALGGLALGLMHLAVVAVALPVYARLLPLAR